MNLAETYKPVTYLDLGFDRFMRRPFSVPQEPVSASEFDAMFELGERAVRTSKLADFAVKNSKIDDLAVTNAKIADASIDSAKIEDAAITTAKIENAAITNAKINDLSAEKITAGIITGRTFRTAEPAAGVGECVVIEGGTSKYVKFYYDDTQRGYIKGYTTEGSEITYIDIGAQSGRHIKLKNSMVEIDGDLVPDTDEAYSCGSRGSNKWNEVVANKFYQQSSSSGDSHVYDFAYIEMGLVDKKTIKKWRTDKDGNKVMRVDGRPDHDGVKLPFKKGTILKWTSKGLKESNHESDLAVAVASERGMPIVLGAEPVRVIGKARIGSLIVPSEKKGCGVAVNAMTAHLENLSVVGVCLENKKDYKEKLTKVMIKF